MSTGSVMSTPARWHSGCRSRLMAPSCPPLIGTGRTSSPARRERPGSSNPRLHVPGPAPTGSTDAVLVGAPSAQEDREAAVGNPLILALCAEVDIAVTDPLHAQWYRVAEHAEHEEIDIDLHEVT